MDVGREEALGALEQAEAMDAHTRGRGRWYAGYATVYAAASCGLLLALGLMPSPVTVAWATPLFLVVIAGLTAFALSRPVQPRGYKALHGGMIAAWSGVYTLTVVVGATAFPGEMLWWTPGALASAVPPLVVAYLALRRGRSTR